jgi:glycosyltransferase involved in cell wall biosynthesis
MTDVAIYMPSLGGGGAERVMVTLANGFAERGLAVGLVLAKAEGPYLGEISKNVEVTDLGASRVLFSLPALVRYLRTARPRAMLSAGSHANVIAVMARHLAKVPTRVVVSERANFSASRQNATSWRSRGLAPMMRWAYRRADRVTAVSAGVADDLSDVIGLPRDRIKVIYNPVVSDTLFNRAEVAIAHPWFGDGTPPVILGVGRLVAQKGFCVLLRAFAKVRASTACRLIILGEGGLRRELESLVQELNLSADVALPGFVDNPFPWMKRASLFVLSSEFEGLPNALIQAMACGTPVVSTNCPSGPSEILEGGRFGRLVPVGDEAALAGAMLAALRETSHPAVAARARSFSAERAVSSYLAALNIGS